jgi:hypothetical protein
MVRFHRCRLLASLAIGASSACTGDGRDADSVRADSAQRAAVALSVEATRHADRPTDAGVKGMWDIVSLEKRLDLQGMVPRRIAEPVHHPFLTVSGTAYHLGNAELQAFIYESASAVARDVAKLDTVAVAPPSAPVQWPSKATLIINSNLAAILLSDDALQIERVQRALMAGTGSTVFDPAARPR